MRFASAFLLGCLMFAASPALKAQDMCPSVMIKQRIQPTTATVVHGTVQDRAGQFIPKVNLTLTGTEKPKLTLTAITDDKGQFHFDSVPAGKYEVTIHWTSGTAKHTEVQCDANGACQIAFALKPPRKAVPCSAAYDNNIRASPMSGTH